MPTGQDPWPGGPAARLPGQEGCHGTWRPRPTGCANGSWRWRVTDGWCSADGSDSSDRFPGWWCVPSWRRPRCRQRFGSRSLWCQQAPCCCCAVGARGPAGHWQHSRPGSAGADATL